MFLAPPKGCLHTPLPSDMRNISDDTLVPAIDVFYGYPTNDLDPPVPCNRFGTTWLFGKMYVLCRKPIQGGVQISVRGFYMADIGDEVDLNLTTTPEHLDRDLAVLRAVAATVAPCRVSDDDEPTPHPFGTGALCPKNGQYF